MRHPRTMLPIPKMHLVIRQRIARSRIIQLQQVIFAPHARRPRTFPGQSKHLIRHSGGALGDGLRKIASNRSSGYVVCRPKIALDNHAGVDCVT